MISKSPLCPHIQNFTPEAERWLRELPVKPQAVKVFDIGAAQAVKRIDPEIVTVVRRFVPDQDRWISDPLSAYDFVPPSLEGVDILEGLNECVPMKDIAKIREVNLWHVNFVKACVKRGVLPCILNLAVGTPEIVDESGHVWDAAVSSLESCVSEVTRANGFIGYHGYGPSRILHNEEWYAFRDALRIEPLLRELGVKGRIQWLHTEAGWDVVSDPTLPSGGWRHLLRSGALTIDEVYAGCEAYANRCVELGIKYAFLYTFWGNDEWADYEHTTHEDWMRWYSEHLKTFVPKTQIAPAPTRIILRVKSAYANLRSLPRLGEETDIGSLIQGSVLTADEYRNGFYHVSGWVGGATVEVLKSYPPDPPTTTTNTTTTSTTTTNTTTTKRRAVRAIDVSDYSGKITRSQLESIRDQYEIEGVIIQIHGGRADGKAAVNRYFKQAYDAALEANLWVAGYVWPPVAVHYRTVGEVLKLSWKFIALDVEGTGFLHKQDIDRLIQLGHVPAIYTSRAQWKNLMSDLTVFQHVPLWEAYYDKLFRNDGGGWNGRWPGEDVWQTKGYGGWTHRCAWQFYGTMKLGQVLCDLNVVDRLWLNRI